MKTYNGHRSWNAWNVALWINNTENIYDYAVSCVRGAIKAHPRADQEHLLRWSALRFMAAYNGEKTPDGAKYNPLAVKSAIEDIVEYELKN